MKLANQSTPIEADLDAVRKILESEAQRKGAVPAAFANLTQQDALDESVEEARRAFAREPNSRVARMKLADAHRERGNVLEAIEHYRVCAEWPEFAEVAQYFLAALGAAEPPTSMPDSLTRNLFDHCASNFENDLVGTLRYQGPALLYRAARDVLGEEARGFDVFDGGCGTGLCGEKFRPMARHLVGVDISAEMIKLARQKGIYEVLIHGELCEVLARHAGAFFFNDTATTEIYTGAPDPIMAAARVALKPDGIFAFTTERLDGSGFDLARTGRYRHSDTCIEEAAAKAGLNIVHVDRAGLRFEQGESVDSTVFVLSRTRSG
jgi:predicted TPR repeat methyltransferase